MSHGALTVDHPVMPDDPPGRLPSYFLLLSYSIHVIKAKCSYIAHPGLMMLFFGQLGVNPCSQVTKCCAWLVFLMLVVLDGGAQQSSTGVLM